jgi:hypothetical protein
MSATALTEKERAFCRYYVVNGGNGKQAAISAGYSQRSAAPLASKLLKKAYIRDEIERVTKLVAEGKLGVIGAPQAEQQKATGGPHPSDSVPVVYTPPPKPNTKAPTDPAISLTRAYLISELMRNARIAMGDEPIEAIVMVKRKKVTANGQPGTEPVIEETVEGVKVMVTAREGAVANQALNLLSQQLDHLKAERGNVPQEVRDFMVAHQDRLGRMQQATRKAAST